MVWPDLKGALNLSGTWTDVTGELYARDPITVSRGRPYRSNAADPAACSATINNKDGKYTPRNPLSTLYGQVGRNTPFRLTLPGGVHHLQTVGNTDGVSTPDAASLDITGDIDIRLELELNDWTRTGSVELCGKWGFPSDKSWILSLSDGRPGLIWTNNGSTAASWHLNTPVTPPQSGRIGLRVTLEVDTGDSCTLSAYTAPSIDGPWTLLQTPFDPGFTTSIASTTAPLYVGAVSTTADLDPIGKFYRFQLRDGIDGTVVADVDFTAQAVGDTSFTDDTDLTWTIRGGAAISDRYTRFTGEVPEWPPKWTPSEADAWAPIQPSGILRRLGQGQATLQSTMRRRIPSFSPLAYWPLEDGKNATQASSPIPGVSPLRISGWDMASNDTLPGSSPLPVLKQGAQLSGSVPAPATGAGAWHTEFVYYLEQAPTDNWTMLQWYGTGTVQRWQLMIGNNQAVIIGYDKDDTQLFSDTVTPFPELFGAWTRWQLIATQNGLTVDWFCRWVMVGHDSLQFSGSYTGALGHITRVSGPSSSSNALDGLVLGHLSVFNVDETFAYNSADIAFTGETAAARMTRLCKEEGVPLTIAGDPNETALVGPQRPAALLDLLRDAAAADGGVFGERIDEPQLQYRTRASMYNQTPKLVLDYSGGDVVPPFEPVEDDQVRNSWEVQRDDGSSGYAVLKDGALSVQAPPDGIGLYQESTTLNLYEDAQTAQMAGWLLHLSTWDEPRYPSVTIRLHKTPDLVPDVLALDVGDMIRIKNLPTHFTGNSTADLLVDSWTETIEPYVWEVTFNCSPAGPWRVGVVVDPNNKDAAGEAPVRVDTGGTILDGDATATATTLDIGVTDGRVWIDSASFPTEFPFDVMVGGERMTVTAITGTTSLQTFTVVRAVNGVSKAQTAGTQVQLATPAAIAL